MATPKRPAKPMADNNVLTVVMDIVEPKRHSIRYKTAAENVPFDNIYISSAAYTQLGRSGKLRVTIEAVE
jgi:hypothetical protein